MTPQQMVVNQDNAHAVFNENMATGQHQYVFGIDPNETGGLIVGYYGSDTDSDDVILWGGFNVAAGTFTLTDDSDNYYVVERATGAPSCSASTTNWNDAAAYARAYKFTAVDGAIAVAEDHRGGPGGVHYGDGVAAGGGLLAANNLSDVDDPAAALVNLGVDVAIAAAITALIGGAPGALDTLNELAAAINDDASYAAAITIALGLKAPLASPPLTGTPTTPTAAPGTGGTQIASQAYADAAAAAAAAGAGGGTVTALSIASGVVNIDCALGDYFTLALSANVTSITFSNLPGAGKGTSKWIEIVQGGAYTVAWPASFKWAGGSAGAVSTSAATDELGITTVNNGTSWKASLGKAFA